MVQAAGRHLICSVHLKYHGSASLLVLLEPRSRKSFLSRPRPSQALIGPTSLCVDPGARKGSRPAEEYCWARSPWLKENSQNVKQRG